MQSRKQGKRLPRRRRTRRRLHQRGGAAAPAQSLEQWISRVKEHPLFGRGDEVLSMAFDALRSDELQLPPITAEGGASTNTAFQLNAQGTSERMFEDADVRQIGNTLRLTPYGAVVAPGRMIGDFLKSLKVEPNEELIKLMGRIEEALRAETIPLSMTLDNTKIYPLFLFYLMMNLPPGMVPDEAIPLTIRAPMR